MNVQNRILIAALGAVIFLNLPLAGQINNTLYFVKGIPQSNRINPAYQPECKFYIGFPLLTPARGGLAFSSQSFGNIIQPHPTEDSLITFLHPLADREAFMESLKPLNLVTSNLGTSLVSFGFRTSVGFFSLDVATRLDGNLRYPGDMVDLLVNGAREGQTYSFDGIGANMSLFDEVSVGWAGSLGDRLDIGVRIKVLFGVGNIYTQDSELSLYTSQESWRFKSDLLIKASLGFADVRYDSAGYPDEIIIDEDLKNLNPYQIALYAFRAGNPGAGIDLGAVFRPTDRLTLNASMVDLAFIRWKEEVHEASFRGEYEFTGIEVNPFDFTEDYTFGDHLDSTLSQLADSISGFLEMGEGKPYTKRLHTKLYLGAAYEITPMLNVGILSRTDLMRGVIMEHITASANFSPFRLMNLTLSYSYMNSSFTNIGAGVSFNVGPLNLYLVSDNALNTIFWPELSHAINFWMGLNLVFGYREKVDTPLIY